MLVLVLNSIDSLIVLGQVSFGALQILPANVDIAARALGNMSRVATLLLAMLISGMAIALPLAANNYTPRLIRIFTADRINRKRRRRHRGKAKGRSITF